MAPWIVTKKVTAFAGINTLHGVLPAVLGAAAGLLGAMA